MAKSRHHTRTRSSRRRNFVAIPFETVLTIGSLAAAGVVSSTALGASFGEDIFLLSMDCTYSLQANTPGNGPLQITCAHGDLTDAEVQEALASELTDPDDIIQKERARRPVRRIGIFPGILADEVLADGTKIKTTLKFSVGDGHNLDLQAHNRDGGTRDTGGLVKVHGVLYGRWQR